MLRWSRRLTDREIERYDVIDPERARRVRLIQVPFVPGGYRAITLRTVIGFVAMPDPDRPNSLLSHELVHVEQWLDRGALRFLATYVGSWLSGLWRHRSFRQAYWNIPAEVEARELATDWFRRHDMFEKGDNG